MNARNIADQVLVCETNLSSVLRLIYKEAPISRAQLATKTGLNKSTVSSLVPEKIILGGPSSVAGDYLLPSIRKTVSKHSLPEIDQQVDIGLSVFGPDASLIGAVAIVVDDVLQNPNHVERR
jgi:hypothetical protein